MSKFVKTELELESESEPEPWLGSDTELESNWRHFTDFKWANKLLTLNRPKN